MSKIGEPRGTEYEEVDVAARALATCRDRSVHERESYLVAQRGKRIAQHICHARSLAQEPGEFQIDRAFCISPIVHLATDFLARQQSQAGQQSQLPMQRAG